MAEKKMFLRLMFACIALAAAPLVYSQTRLKLPCAETDKDCVFKLAKSHPVHNLDTWKGALARPVGERIGPATPQLVEYLNLDNIFHGYPERPRAAKLDPAFLADVRGAIADLPPAIWKLFNERFIGLYFVEDLGGTGFTDFVADKDKKAVAGYVVLDAAILGRQTANAWATWKENTPFKVQTVFKLDARIEDDANDNRRNAIQYILLHELGHVLSIGSDFHPLWAIAPKDVPATAKFPFFSLSWKIDREADKYVTLFEAALPQRKDVVYYFGAKLAATEMVPAYTNLEKTNFPSLYAATRPGDDFAEAFASYVHVVLMKRPWQVTISRNGEVQKVFKACWEEARCAEKRKILEKIVGAPKQ
jgi:hypothetical protein